MAQPIRRPAVVALRHAALVATVAAAPYATVLSQGIASIPPERLAAREWYQDARFGLFIHWGVYSLLGQGEWVMQNRKITVPEYEWLASTFNPSKFDARAWVGLARA